MTLTANADARADHAERLAQPDLFSTELDHDQ